MGGNEFNAMKKNKFISVILVGIICLNWQISVFAALGADEAAAADTELCTISQSEWEHMYILKQLGIIEPDADCDGKLTRAEFILSAMVIRGYKGKGEPVERMPFNDVLNDHKSAGAIVFAAALGILDPGDGNLRPEEPADLEFASKLLLDAMGYRELARQRGSYTDMTVYVKLMRGINPSPDGTLTKAQAYEMLFRTLGIDILKESEYSKSANKYETDGKSMMNEYMDIYNEKGRITANRFVSIDGNTVDENDEVIIGGETYKTGNTDAVGLVGCEVDIYYYQENENRGDKELVAVQRDNNKDLKIYADDIADYKNGTYTYYKKSGNKATASVGTNAFIIYNGKQLEGSEYSEERLKPKMGYVELLSGGTGYDVISIVSDFDCVVDAVISTDGVYAFLDKYSHENKIVFDIGNIDTYVEIKDTAGEKLNPDVIKNNDVLTVTKSLDGSVIKITVCTDSKLDILTGLYKDGFMLGETDYKYSEQLKKILDLHSPLSTGSYYMVYFNTYGKAAAVVVSESVAKYAYITKMSLAGGLRDRLKFRVFNDDGSFSTIELSQVKIDGVKYTGSKLDDAAEIFTEDGEFVPQLVSIFYGKDGTVSRIDTAVKNDIEPENTVKMYRPSEDMCKTKISDNGRAGYRYQSAVPYFDGGVYVKSDAKVFLVPKGRYGDEEDYCIKTINYFKNGFRYDTTAYTQDDQSGEAEAIVCKYFPKYSNNSEDRDPLAPTGAAMPFVTNSELLTAFVESVSNAVDSDGEVRKKLNLITLNTYAKSSYFLRYDDLADNLEEGTVIRYFVGPNGKINFLELLFNCNTREPMKDGAIVNNNGEWTIRTHTTRNKSNRNIVCTGDDFSPAAFFATWRLSYFDTYEIKNGYLTLTLQDLRENPVPDPALTDNYKLSSFKTVYRYDSRSRELTQANAAEIVGYDADPENYSKMLVLSSGMVSISAAVILD